MGGREKRDRKRKQEKETKETERRKESLLINKFSLARIMIFFLKKKKKDGDSDVVRIIA